MALRRWPTARCARWRSASSQPTPQSPPPASFSPASCSPNLYSTAPPGRGPARARDPVLARCGNRTEAREEPRHRLPRATPGNEDQPRAVVVFGPVVELDRRVCDVLDDINDDRTT